MASMEQGDQQTNITSALEALSPWLNNPRRTVIQVEVFMAAAAVLLFFQLIFGSVRRRTNKFFIQGGLWLAYTLLLPLITYTLGQMQSSPVKSALYPVWGLSLVLVAGGANSITAYDLDDNKQWKRHIFDLLQCYIYIGILFELLYPDKSLYTQYYLFHFSPSVMRQPVSIPLFLLVGSVFIANMFGIVAGWMVNHADASKVVADYMKDHANSRGDSQEFNPVSMKDCKYLVHWPTYLPAAWRGDGSPVYRSKLPEEAIITVGMVWEMCNNEDSSMSPGVSSRIEGACLSFALSHLLRRRFFGMDCAEASLSETREFVLEGLLSENNNDKYTEAFKLIEVELGFLYDSFYTKYASIFEMENGFFLVVIMKIISTLVVGIILLFKSPIIKTPNPIIQVDTRTADTIITVVILGTFIAVEALQSILYLGTDWAMVSLACYYNKGRHGHGLWCIPFALHKTCAFLSRRPLFSYWQNNIGQYSVIEGSQHFRGRKAFGCLARSLTLFPFFEFMVYAIWDTLRKLFPSKGLHFVKLPHMMKNEIISALKSNSDGHLANGKASLRRNGVFEQFSWTLCNETQTENMLIWHIATDYCKIALGDEEFVGSAEELEKRNQYRKVATKLSNYCAYLMSEVPELIPGNFADTKFVFHSAVFEAREALGTKTRNRDVLPNAMGHPGQEDTIFVKGLKLGTMLKSIQDSFLRWKLMAEFWAETILYIAPSDNAKAHMEHLAQGGEFLTHIWALLTHAGILTRPQPEKPTPGEDIA
ncbi:unnamed protein product [Urochloa decumbens]|uniref:DUF4220 domain-containing protein n=1 Tax=Urochloa decumbens TaxID=240449 RepID=A0ABC9A2B7_9POAL